MSRASQLLCPVVTGGGRGERAIAHSATRVAQS